MKHLGTKKLETSRLILRKFELSDAEAIYDNWANDNEVTKYLMWPTHKDSSVTTSVLKEWVGQYDNDKFYQWAIVLKSNGNDPIGSISIVNILYQLCRAYIFRPSAEPGRRKQTIFHITSRTHDVPEPAPRALLPWRCLPPGEGMWCGTLLDSVPLAPLRECSVL
jgi:hypothetical protein